MLIDRAFFSFFFCSFFFFFQAEDGIRDFCLSRGLGDVYKRQHTNLGIYAVQKRLEYVYHGKAKMTITSEQEKGTLVVLEIPLKKAKEIMENGTSGNDIG